MRTVSTKLDKKDHERLLEMCNKEGQSVAEALREMVQDSCGAWEDCVESEKPVEFIEPTKTESEYPKITILRIFTCSNGNLYEDGDFVGSCSDYDLIDGNVWKDGKQIGVIEN